MLNGAKSTDATVEVSATTHLASILMQDIRRRGLQTGDRYLTDQQAADLLQVGRISAHRAMRHLAERKLVVRRPRAGTFVGPSVLSNSAEKLGCVHVLIPALMRGLYRIDPIIEGLSVSLPAAQVQINFVPSVEPLPFLRRLIDQAVDSGAMTGIVLASTSRQTREFFSNLNLPVVVSGHVESDIDLPWVDRDQKRIGQILVEFLLERGHRGIGLIMRDFWAPGDNLMSEGVSGALNGTGTRLMVHSTPLEDELTQQIIRNMLGGPDRPTGLICRSENQAFCVAASAEQMGLSVPDDLEIVAANIMSSSSKSKDIFPHASSDLRLFGVKAGLMLSQLDEGKRPDPYQCELPVSMEIPAAYPAVAGTAKEC